MYFLIGLMIGFFLSAILSSNEKVKEVLCNLANFLNEWFKKKTAELTDKEVDEGTTDWGPWEKYQKDSDINIFGNRVYSITQKSTCSKTGAVRLRKVKK